MTEEILQAAIMRLRSKATERFAIIKDLYHRPATGETTDQIVQHAVALAQLEGAMITLQNYAGPLARQTENEAVSNTPEQPVTEVEAEEDDEEQQIYEKLLEDVEQEEGPLPPDSPNHDELMKRSTTYRNSQRFRGKKSES